MRRGRRIAWLATHWPLLFTALFWGAAATYVALTPDAPLGAVHFLEGRAIRLGSLPAGMHTRSIRIVNTSGARLELRQITASCGCVSSSISRSSLTPGEQATCTYRLLVHPRDRKTISLVVHVASTGKSWHERLVIGYEGLSRGRLVAEPGSVMLDGGLMGQTREFSVVFSWLGGTPGGSAQRLSVRVAPEHLLRVRSQRVVAMDPWPQYEVCFVAEMPEAGRAIRGELQAEVGWPVLADCRIPVVIVSDADLSLEPSVIVAKLEAHTATRASIGRIALTGDSEWAIVAASAPSWLECVLDEGPDCRSAEFFFVGESVPCRLSGDVSLRVDSAHQDGTDVIVAVALEVVKP